ncbi:MAG TPA: hypothetical protein VMT53_05935 [Terriglobales bacterium]|nr:hypothetical protein [Terriglobales bacterium]
MFSQLKWRVAMLAAVAVVLSAGAWQRASADEDLVHIVKGTVKSVDRGSKTMVVKTADGTEHTVKWTDKTTWEGMKDTGEGVAEGSKVTVKYTEKAGEKTAVGVKTTAKATAKAVSQ